MQLKSEALCLTSQLYISVPSAQKWIVFIYESISILTLHAGMFAQVRKWNGLWTWQVTKDLKLYIDDLRSPYLGLWRKKSKENLNRLTLKKYFIFWDISSLCKQPA